MSEVAKTPPITQQPIQHIDGTPDAGYVLRILRAYRENCNCRWKADPPSVVCDMMNQHCEQRAVLLDEAIRKLTGEVDQTNQMLTKAKVYITKLEETLRWKPASLFPKLTSKDVLLQSMEKYQAVLLMRLGLS